MDVPGPMLGAEIRRRRGSAGLTTEAFASRLGCQAGYLVAIEEERLQPSEDFLRKIADELDEVGAVPGADLLQLARLLPAEPPDHGFAVREPGGQVRYYVNTVELRDSILQGRAFKTWDARRLAPVKAGAKAAEPKWLTLETLSESEFALRSLYRPVWAHTMRGALIGFIVVDALQALNLTVSLVSVNLVAAVAWLLVLGAIFSPKFKMELFIVAMFVMVKAQLPNLWLTVFGVAAFGGAFGCPAGAGVGTAVGYLRLGGLPKPADARPEGRRPLLLGLVLPLGFLAAAVPFYVLWLTPRVSAWLSGQP